MDIHEIQADAKRFSVLMHKLNKRENEEDHKELEDLYIKYDIGDNMVRSKFFRMFRIEHDKTLTGVSEKK